MSRPWCVSGSLGRALYLGNPLPHERNQRHALDLDVVQRGKCDDSSIGSDPVQQTGRVGDTNSEWGCPLLGTGMHDELERLLGAQFERDKVISDRIARGIPFDVFP